MFCPLFRLFSATTVEFHDFEHCDNKCPHYVNVVSKDKCNICKIKNEKLTTEKYGWLLDVVIDFKKPTESKTIKTKFISFISLIHPSEKDLWIAKYSNKKEKIRYMLYTTDKKFDFDDFYAMNAWLKKQNYNGRELNDKDFSI